MGGPFQLQPQVKMYDKNFPLVVNTMNMAETRQVSVPD